VIKIFRYSLALLLLVSSVAKAQDDCSGATTLCAGSSRSGNTNIGTVSGSDPALSCGDMVVNGSLWYSILAVNNGTCTVTVNNILQNPGLDMEIYTGTCGSLVSTGNCASGNSGTGFMSITFATTAGTTYFVLVDANSGNNQTFNIIATTTNDAIVARPDANFDVNPVSGCVPLNVVNQNTTTLHGGTGVTYEWKVDAGSYLPATGTDTSILFSSVGTHTTTLRVCNAQCGCKTVSQDVTVQDLVPSISYLPATTCVGSPITFNGSASIQPTPPVMAPGVTLWSWNFGDPASGASNTATGQSVVHTFAGAGPSFTVKLVIQGNCGPDSITTTINLKPLPIATVTNTTQACEGATFDFDAVPQSGQAPYTYLWNGPGTISCTNCDTMSVPDLTAGGPYTFDLAVTDANGCEYDTSMDVMVDELPMVFAGGIITVCPNDSADLDAIAWNGMAPYIYDWSPGAGLSDSTIETPYTFNTNNTTYCVVVTDFNGCTSQPDCVDINQYPTPTIAPSSANLCSSQTPLTNTFNVAGPNPGSTYSWALSPDYATITNAAPDSSSIDAAFPATPGTYNYTCIVTDGLTGCIDTVTTSFSVTAGLSLSVSGPSTICAGDSATLTVTGANTYTWSANPPYFFADPNDSVQVVQPMVPTVFTIMGTQGTCTATINDSLLVSAYPNAVINPVAPFCGCTNIALNGTGSTAGMNYLWTSVNGSSITAPANLVTSATVCAFDSIFLTVTDPVSGCASRDSATVNPRPRPSATATVNPDTICNGVSTVITLDATGSFNTPATTYLWTSAPAVSITDSSAFSTTANVNGSTQFTLTVTDSTGCDSTISAMVNIHPLPAISANGPFICTTDPVWQSTVTVTGAAPGSTYTWTTIPACVTPSTTSAASQLFDFTTCSVAGYNFDIDVYDPTTTCTTSVSTTVNLIAGVNLIVNADTITDCEGASFMLAASGANTYSWSNGDVTDTIYPSNLTAAGSPYLFIVAGAVGSCSDTDSIVVIVNPIPLTDTIVGPTNVCENDANTVYSVTNTPGSTYNWLVSGGNIFTGQGTSSIIVDWGPSGSAFIMVIETSAGNCDGTPQTLNFNINPVPTAPVVTGPDTVCQGDIATYFVTPSAGSTYTWTITGGTYLIGQYGVVNIFQWDSAGTDTINVFETTVPGCSGPSATYLVTAKTKPATPVISGNNMVCDNVTEYYSVSSNAGSVFTWTVVGAASVVANATNDTITVSWGSAGIGSVKVYETNTAGCLSDTAVMIVNIYNHPQANIPDPLDSICNGPYQIVASASTPNVLWQTDGNGTFNSNTITNAIYTPAVTDTGYYHLTMIVNNPACQNDTGRITLYISPSPIVSITGPAGPICYGTLDSLHATGGGSYIWTPGGIPGPVIGIRPVADQMFYVTVTNGFNCSTTDSFFVTVIPPGVPVAGVDQVVCAGDSVALNGSQSGASGLYWRSTGDGIFSPDTISPSVIYYPGIADTSSHFATIYLTTTGACLDQSDTLSLTINGQAFIAAGSDTTITGGASSQASIPLTPFTTNVTSIQWTTSGTGTFDPSDTSLVATYIPSAEDYNQQQIFLIAASTNTCNSAIDTLVIDFTPFTIPNVFTPYPLSPGFNDYFRIANLTGTVGLKVWDRWGSLVYTSDNYQNDWDGHGLDAGVYYYVVNSAQKGYKGWVQLIR
jgi:hypothetical protein